MSEEKILVAGDFVITAVFSEALPAGYTGGRFAILRTLVGNGT